MSLTINNLTVLIANKPVVKDVSLSVAPGKVTAILGANGAGKSELVLAAAGMLDVSKGFVHVDGQDITNEKPDAIRRAGVAAVPEGHRILTKLSVDDNLRAAGSMLATGLVETLDKTYMIFPELAKRKSQIAGTLSGGQQQMMALGHALMSQPKYVLLDEMSLGLAPLIVKRLMGVAKDMATAGTGIILIEQFTELALDLADYACVLNDGEMHFSGVPSLLQSHPEILKEAYFGS
jgi:branched-chain amino acid transport system ATP-binding protein